MSEQPLDSHPDAHLDPLTFPLHGSRLIEASAGTGKTWTIAALYLRLVLGHGDENGFGEPLLPPRILVVTFTIAATRELRDRIRNRLGEAATAFRHPDRADPDDGVLAGLLAAYPEAEARARCARRLEVAAEWMDEAAIHTIHAFSQRMLREHAFRSRHLFHQRLEPDTSERLLEAVRDYWRSQVVPRPADEAELLMTHLGGDPDALKARLRPWLETPLSPPDDAARDARLHEVLAALEAMKRPLRGDFDAVAESFFAALPGLNRQSYKKPEDLLADLRAWADQPGLLTPPGYGMRVFELLSASGMRAKLKKGHSLPDDLHPALAGLDAAETLESDPTPFLAHAAAWIRQRFEAAKREHAELDFGDLVSGLRAALEGAAGRDLAETIRAQYPVALIDEFQDTDPAQYAVFDAVYDVEMTPADRGLFLIGDPKQAIYGFRGADIHSYLAARRATTGRHYTLPKNYRATEAAVSAVNRLFGHAAGHARGAFLFRQAGDDPVPFHAVEARGRGEQLRRDGVPVPALTLWHRRPSEAVAMGPYRDEAAEAGATAITDLLLAGRSGEAAFHAEDGTARGVEPADIAVLVRDRQEAEAIRGALHARGVASVYLSLQDSVWASDEAGDLHLWLRACAEPESESAVRAALATPTLGRSLDELERLTRDESAWEAVVLRFHHYRRIWRRQGVLPLLRRLLHDEGVPARLLAEDGGERRLTNLLHLGELLQQAAAGLDGEHALLRHLAAERETGGSGDDGILRLESDAERVRVVTIHKAKGLEYPLVFLPFASGFKPVDRSKAPLRYRNDEGRWVIDPAPDDEAVARADDERLAEDLRLFYVALTRARHATWVGLAPVKRGRKKDNDLHRTAPGYLLTGGSALDAGDLPQRLHDLAGEEAALAVAPFPAPDRQRLPASEETAAPGEARRPTRSPAERWWIASYSALALGHGESSHRTPETATADLVDEMADEAPAPGASGGGLLDFPRGPEPGTFLHGLLEWAAGEGLATVAADPDRLASTVAERCRRRGWADHAPAVTDWLQRLLTEPLALSSGAPVRLADLGQYQPELEFWLGVHDLPAGELDAAVRAATLGGEERPPVGPAHLNGLLKGFIDLVFEHEGRYWVADYKSNFLGPRPAAYAPDHLRQAVLERRYELQYTLYTLALHRQLKARLPDYDYDRHMGGAVYLFLRGLDAPGQGLHCERPPRALIEELDARLRGPGTRPDGGDTS